MMQLLWGQAEIDRFWGALAGTFSVGEFFSPEHMERIIAEGSQSTPAVELAF